MSPEPEKSPTESQPVLGYIRDISSLITAITGIVALIGVFTANLQTWLPLLRGVDKITLGIAATILLSVALFFQRHRLTKRSELLKPRALEIDPHITLVGRDQDILNLKEHVNNTALVWLVGESGAGKSALLTAGLIPLLRKSKSIAIYLVDWGSDWILGPQESLTQAINEFLLEGGASSEKATVDTVFTILGDLKDKLGQAPLLIFDQFDDYQNRHWTEFVTRSGSITSTRSLLAKNHFWHSIRDLLIQGKIRCIFAARSDTQFGLQAVQFMQPVTYPLYRLERGYVLPLLNQITADGVVSNPDAGWDRLKRRLAQDLEVNGNTLPIQMTLAFRGLTRLESLTPAAYERSGGLTGMEAGFIDFCIAEAARSADIPKETVRCFLLKMISETGTKTIPVTVSDLMTCQGNLSQNAVLGSLRTLAIRHIIRDRYDPDTKEVVYVLDHDYLVNGVLELERRATYWSHYLQGSFIAFTSAPSLLSKWKHLLPPAKQLRLLYERLLGQIVFGRARTLIWLSALKLIFSLPVLLLLVAAWLWNDNRQTQTAVTLSADFGSDNPDLSATEAKTLWKLTSEPLAVRRKFLQNLLETESGAARFDARSRRVLHALVGLRFYDAGTLGRRLLPSCYSRDLTQSSRVIVACGALIEAFDSRSESALRFYIATIPKSDSLLNGYGLSDSLVDGLRSTGLNADDETVQKVAPFVLSSLKGTHQPYQLGLLSGALSTVGPRLPKESAAEAAAWTTKVLCDTHYAPQQSLLASGLRSFTTHLDSQALQPAVECLTNSIGQTQSYDSLAYFGEGLGALRSAVSAPTLEHTAKLLIEQIKTTPRPDFVVHFAKAISALQRPLNGSQLNTLADLIIGRLGNTNLWNDFHDLPKPMGEILKSQSPRSAKIITDRIMSVVKRTDDPNRLYALAEIVIVSGVALPKPDAIILSDRLLQSLSKVNSAEMQQPGFAGEIGEAAGTIMKHFSSEPEGKTFRTGIIRKATANADDAEILAAYVRAYTAFGSNIPTESDKLLDLSWQSLLSLNDRGRYNGALIKSLAGLNSNFDENKNRANLDKLLEILRPKTTPECESISPFLRRSTLPEAIDVLQWPTCTPEMVDQILDRVEIVVDKQFKGKEDGSYESRLREFSLWAHDNRLETVHPPKPPIQAVAKD